MASPNFSRPAGQYIFSTGYTLLAVLITFFIAIELQSGSSGIYVFVRDDLLTDYPRLGFVCGLPVAYIASFVVCHFLIKMPRFDSFNRIIVINLIVYGFFGLILSISRIHLFSRTVILSEFIVTTILLVAFYFIRYRIYPTRLGILPPIDINQFKGYPYLRVTNVKIGSSEIYSLDGIVSDLHRNYDGKTSHFLAELAQKQVPVYHANSLIEAISSPANFMSSSYCS